MTEVKTDINFIQMANDIAKIKQAVLGNGVPGLCERIKALEESQKRQGWVYGFWCGIGFVFGWVITVITNFIKGG